MIPYISHSYKYILKELSTLDITGIMFYDIAVLNLNNKFINNINTGMYKPKKCYNCIISCNPATTPYCITQALINSVKGDVDNGLVFCGENAYKVDKIITVKELLDELTNVLHFYTFFSLIPFLINIIYNYPINSLL